MHRYRVCGLDLHSELPLPGLPGPPAGAEPLAPPEVVIRLGTAPRSLDGREVGLLVEARRDEFLLSVEGVARYFVREGRDVTIEPASSASEAALRLFLAGPVFAALLLERGLLPLHASAVRAGDGVVAFAAPSGGGKSALAASLARRGFAVFADDVLAVGLDRLGRPIAWQGFASPRLWMDTLRVLEIDPSACLRVRPELEKFEWQVDEIPLSDPGPLDFEGLWILRDERSRAADEAGAGEAVVPIQGARRLKAVLEQTHGRSLIEPLGRVVEHFRVATAVAARVPAYEIIHPHGLEHLGRLAGRVEDELARASIVEGDRA